MRESKAVYVTRHKIRDDQDIVYQLNTSWDREHTRTNRYNYSKNNEFACQFDSKKDTCTCRNVYGRHEIYFSKIPRQVYAYHGSRSFTDIGVGSVKALQRRKVKRVYLPETDDRGVGSSDLSAYTFIRRTRPYKGSFYDHKKTSSKCVGGIIEYNTGCALSEKLSPIVNTKSGTTSPKIPDGHKNIEIGSNTVVKKVETVGTQFEIDEKEEKVTPKKEELKLEATTTKVCEPKQKYKKSSSIRKLEKKIIEAERQFSSDSLVQHVHDLEVPSDDKPSKTSMDPMENKLEREYRRMFATKDKDSKSSCYKPIPEYKSASVLKRRFEALRRGLTKKDDLKKSSFIPKSSQSRESSHSRKDASVTSDPPSLEGRSFSDAKRYIPIQANVIEQERPRMNYRNERDSIQYATEMDSDYQGVRGMFKLWGKKFNLDEDWYTKKQASPLPSYNSSKKSEKDIEKREIEKTEIEKQEIEKKEIEKIESEKKKPEPETKKEKRFFFFKKKIKEKPKDPYHVPPKKKAENVTAGRCEITDGLTIKMGRPNTAAPMPKEKTSKATVEEGDLTRKRWLRRFLSSSIESARSVNVRWANTTYTTSSSTLFDLIDTVYKNTGIFIKSHSEISSLDSYYRSNTNKHKVNFMQDIEAWMIPKTITDKPKVIPVNIICSKKDIPQTNIELSYFNQKWIIDQSRALSHKIEVVLHSKNLNVKRKVSSDYLRIDIPKDFFDNLSSDESKRNQTSDEEVYKIVEYESDTETKKVKRNIRMDKGDNPQSDIKVIVSVQDSKNLESKIVETVIKRPPTHRDVIIQGSNVNIPKRCDVIGVGIITQRDLREMRKPILKFQDVSSSEDSEPPPLLKQKKCEFAESYLQEYYKHWTPLGLDLYSCVSDSHLKSCSEKSLSSHNQQGDASKSCPNICDDYQASTVMSSSETSSDSAYNKENESKGIDSKGNERISSKYVNFMKKKDKDNVKENDKDIDDSGEVSAAEMQPEVFTSISNNKGKRFLPKDSLEVFKKRKIYAQSRKSEWCCAQNKPVSVPSSESRGEQDYQDSKGGGGSGGVCLSDDCPRIQKPVLMVPTRKKACKKHVSMPDCETLAIGIKKQIAVTHGGILNFKGSVGCDLCKNKKGVTSSKHANVRVKPSLEIPEQPCKVICIKQSNPNCLQPGSPSCNTPTEDILCPPPPRPCCPPTPPSCPSTLPSCPPTPPSCPPSPPKCPSSPPPCPPPKRRRTPPRPASPPRSPTPPCRSTSKKTKPTCPHKSPSDSGVNSPTCPTSKKESRPPPSKPCPSPPKKTKLTCPHQSPPDCGVNSPTCPSCQKQSQPPPPKPCPVCFSQPKKCTKSPPSLENNPPCPAMKPDCRGVVPSCPSMEPQCPAKLPNPLPPPPCPACLPTCQRPSRTIFGISISKQNSSLNKFIPPSRENNPPCPAMKPDCRGVVPSCPSMEPQCPAKLPNPLPPPPCPARLPSCQRPSRTKFGISISKQNSPLNMFKNKKPCPYCVAEKEEKSYSKTSCRGCIASKKKKSKKNKKIECCSPPPPSVTISRTASMHQASQCPSSKSSIVCSKCSQCSPSNSSDSSSSPSACPVSTSPKPCEVSTSPKPCEVSTSPIPCKVPKCPIPAAILIGPGISLCSLPHSPKPKPKPPPKLSPCHKPPCSKIETNPSNSKNSKSKQADCGQEFPSPTNSQCSDQPPPPKPKPPPKLSPCHKPPCSKIETNPSNSKNSKSKQADCGQEFPSPTNSQCSDEPSPPKPKPPPKLSPCHKPPCSKIETNPSNSKNSKSKQADCGQEFPSPTDSQCSDQPSPPKPKPPPKLSPCHKPPCCKIETNPSNSKNSKSKQADCGQEFPLPTNSQCCDQPSPPKPKPPPKLSPCHKPPCCKIETNPSNSKNSKSKQADCEQEVPSPTNSECSDEPSPQTSEGCFDKLIDKAKDNKSECSKNCIMMKSISDPAPEKEECEPDFSKVKVAKPVCRENKKKGLSGLFLRKNPSKKKTCAKECRAWGNESSEPGFVRLNSREKISINLKEKSPSTEEIRECVNVKVKGEDGRTLYERKDYNSGKNRSSVCGNIYDAKLNRISTPVMVTNLASETHQDISNTKSEQSLSNLVEIQFKLRIVHGDKTTEINIGKEEDQEEKKDEIENAPEVYSVKRENDERNEITDEGSPKNDINIKIIVKNYKPKSEKRRCEKEKQAADDYYNKISHKFNTVSTGYSDIYTEPTADSENVFSVHRATINLTSSTERSKTHSVASNERSKTHSPLSNERSKTHSAASHERSKIHSATSNAKSESHSAVTNDVDESVEPIEQLSNTKSNTVPSLSTEELILITEDEATDYTKSNSQGYDTHYEYLRETYSNYFNKAHAKTLQKEEERETQTLQKLETVAVKSEEKIQSKSKENSKLAKKDLLKRVFQRAHSKPKSKGRVRQLREMLKIILTDSSTNDDLTMTSNDLAKDVTYTSLKSNYFKDTDSMNNYYKMESAISSLKFKNTILDPNNYPTKENNSNDTEDESGRASPQYKGCMCSKVVEKIKDPSLNISCCCRRKSKQDGEVNCDLNEDCYRLCLDAETQKSTVLTKVISNKSTNIPGTIVSKIREFTTSKIEKLLPSYTNKHINNKTVLNSELTNVKHIEHLILNNESKRTDRKRKYDYSNASDILQCYETKKAVLEIYAEKTYSEHGEHLVAKLPKFLYEKESEIEKNYDKIATNSYMSVCTKNIFMMSISR